MKKSKVLTVLLSFVMVASLLVGCAGGTNGGSGVDGKTTITIWTTRPESTEPTSDHMRMLAWAEEYSKSNTDNIQVEVVSAKTDDVILTSIASGTTPDIFMGYWNTTSTWAENGALLDLTDYIENDATFDKDDFVDVGWEQATHNGQIYGVPFFLNTTLLYYRTDLLKEAGYEAPPQTLEELEEMALALTLKEGNGDITQAGLIPDYPWLDNVCWPVMTGARWIDESTNTITFNTDEMKEAYQWQIDIYKALGADKIAKFKDGLGARNTAEDAMVVGKTAMGFFSELKIPSMVEFGKDIEWGVSRLPHGKNVEAGSANMMTTNQLKINANTANPDAAWKVLSNLTSAETMASFAEGEHNNGMFYARKSAIEAVKAMDNVHATILEVADIMLEEGGRGFPNSAYVNVYLSAISDQMMLALVGDKSIEDACKEVEETIQPLADAAAK